MPKSCIDPGRPSPSTPPSAPGRGSAWRARFWSFWSRWLRLSTGLYVSLAFACFVHGQEPARPRERVRFLDGKTELCEVVSRDADGATLRLEGLPKPVKFPWWQLAPEDAARLREGASVAPAAGPAAGDLTVGGVRLRTREGRTYEGVLVPGAPEGELWVKNAEGKFVVRQDDVTAREEIRVELQRAYTPDEVVSILAGRIRPQTPEDYDRLGNELLRAKLQARAVSAFKVAQFLRHPEWPEARLYGELVRLRERLTEAPFRKLVVVIEERTIAGDYDGALAEMETLETILSGKPGAGPALEELRRVRAQLQSFRGLARDERIVQEGWRAIEAFLKARAMDRSGSYEDARAWVEQRLPAELIGHLRAKFNFSPDDPTVQRVRERRPEEMLLKHSYEEASWVAVSPELRPPAEWWSAAEDASRYALLKGLFIEKHLKVVRAESKSCSLCGGTGVVEKSESSSAVCPSCRGLKAFRVLIYR